MNYTELRLADTHGCFLFSGGSRLEMAMLQVTGVVWPFFDADPRLNAALCIPERISSKKRTP